MLAPPEKSHLWPSVEPKFIYYFQRSCLKFNSTLQNGAISFCLFPLISHTILCLPKAEICLERGSPHYKFYGGEGRFDPISCIHTEG